VLEVEYCQTCSEITGQYAVNVTGTSNTTLLLPLFLRHYVGCFVTYFFTQHLSTAIIPHLSAFKYLWLSGPLILVIGLRHASSYSFIFIDPSLLRFHGSSSVVLDSFLTDCPSYAFIVIAEVAASPRSSYLNGRIAFRLIFRLGYFLCRRFHFVLCFECYHASNQSYQPLGETSFP